MKKALLAGILLAVGGVFMAAQSSNALVGIETEGVVKSVTDRVQENTKNVRSETENLKRQELETKRAEVEQRIAEKKAAVTEKLSGLKAERCAKKQVNINHMLDKRVNAAQRHFERFKTIEDRLVAFVAKKNLTVENASALELIMKDKQTAAQAALDGVSNVNFDCSSADSAKPGGIVIEQIAIAKQSLKDYRTAIKNYANAVKNAANVERETITDTSEGGER